MSYSNVYTLNVDLKQTMTSVVPTFAQGETGVLRFRLFDDGKDLDTTPYTYSEIVHKLPSGNKVMGNLDLVIVDGERLLEYRYTGMEMAELGKVEVQLVIQSTNTNVAIRPFKIVIYDDMRDDDLTYVGILQELIAEVSLLKEEMYKAINSWVWRDSYDNSIQYYRHNVVEYQGSSWIALRDTKGNPPPTLPTISNMNWYLVARKADGGGTVNSINGILPDTSGNVQLPLGEVTQSEFEDHINKKATTTQYGHTKLNNTLTSNSIEESATANTVKVLNDKVDTKFDKTGGRINGDISIGTRKLVNESILIGVDSPTYGTVIKTDVSGGGGEILFIKLNGYAPKKPMDAESEWQVYPIEISIAIHSIYLSSENRFTNNTTIFSTTSYKPTIKVGFSDNASKKLYIYIDTRDRWWTNLSIEGINISDELTIIDSNLELLGSTYITTGTYFSENDLT